MTRMRTRMTKKRNSYHTDCWSKYCRIAYCTIARFIFFASLIAHNLFSLSSCDIFISWTSVACEYLHEPSVQFLFGIMLSHSCYAFMGVKVPSRHCHSTRAYRIELQKLLHWYPRSGPSVKPSHQVINGKLHTRGRIVSRHNNWIIAWAPKA
jgi:hypothetical protein